MNKTSGRINWTIIIIVVLVGVGGWLIPSPFQKTVVNNPVQYQRTLVPGRPDSTYINRDDVTGIDNTVDHVQYVAELEPVTVIAIPDYVENEVVILDNNLTGKIRATAYPYIQQDTLKIDLTVEYNLEPRGLEIVRVDTLKVPTPVPIEPTVLQKPEIVIPSTALITTILILILIL